jgi:AcrR family transcriptional regulator
VNNCSRSVNIYNGFCDKVHTLSVNKRSHKSRRSHGSSRSGRDGERRTQAKRREHTRHALLDAALEQVDAGESFEALSLRSVARTAGVAPAAFYRYFASMDELGLALVEESFRTLRAMLREAREGGLPPEHMIRRSVEILIEDVLAHRQHFTFIARVRSSGDGVLRHAVRSEIRLLISELATDLARFPVLREWTTEDLQMLAGVLVNTMIAIVEAILELPANGHGRGDRVGADGALADIARIAEKQIRLPLLAVPHWRSAG